METPKRRIRSIVEQECLLQDIYNEFIEAGCSHAESLFDSHQSFATSVYAGVCLAQDLATRETQRKNYCSSGGEVFKLVG